MILIAILTRLRRIRGTSLLLAAFALPPAVTACADEPTPAGDRLTRLHYQDHDTQQIKWLDVLMTPERNIAWTKAVPVGGLPQLDTGRQKFVQMEESHGYLLAGVRDDDRGNFQSGWILVDTGVDSEDHGDHAHWHYPRPSAVKQARLDTAQGNPAHLYLYDEVFYLANDQKNGYTRLDPRPLVGGKSSEPVVGFHQGGGQHITLAAVGDRVGYGTWAGGQGESAGRIDVTRLRPNGNDEIAYRFKLPHGGLHGAAVCRDKVFFAPSEGIDWVPADVELTGDGRDVAVHHLSLGSQGEKPRRTGAFATWRDHVLCVTGKGEGTSLMVLDAREAEPKPTELKLPLKAGQQATTPRVVRYRKQTLAFVFHDHPQDADVADELTIVDLDPNNDGAYLDAVVRQTMPVGPSELEGHNGHHAVSFDAGSRWAFWTNPGDGTISVMNLRDLQVTATIPVGGKPTALVATGGRESQD